MIKDVATWLKKNPPKGQVFEIQNGTEKVKIIPQKIIESLLDELTEQNWSTENFHSSIREKPIYGNEATGEVVKRVTYMDASLELVVTYKQYDEKKYPNHALAPVITRRLVGAYTFPIDLFGNDYINNIAKSLCITNAASDLGARFGKNLNPKEASMMILGIKNPPKKIGDSKIGDTIKKIEEKK